MKYDSTGRCGFCGQPGETRVKTRDGELRFCRPCAKKELLPAVAQALGHDELRRAAAEDQAVSAILPGKLERLAADAGRSGGRHAVPVEALMSRGLGQPPRRRAMTAEQQRTALARAQARQRGQALPADIAAMVRKSGLRTA